MTFGEVPGVWWYCAHRGTIEREPCAGIIEGRDDTDECKPMFVKEVGLSQMEVPYDSA